MGDLGKIIVATGFKNLPKVQKSPNLVTQVPFQKCIPKLKTGQTAKTVSDSNCSVNPSASTILLPRVRVRIPSYAFFYLQLNCVVIKTKIKRGLDLSFV